MIDLGARPFRLWRLLRRSVLRHRRGLAALLTGVAVLATVSALRAPASPRETVLVAAHDLPAGAVLAADDLRDARWAPGTTPDDLAPDPVGRMLAAPLRRGEPVTDLRLVGPDLAGPGVDAVPVRFPDSATADLLGVGDHIDLLAADPQGGDAARLVDDVAVLALPAPVVTDASSALPGRVVVVGVPPDAVTDVAQASVTSFVTYDWSDR